MKALMQTGYGNLKENLEIQEVAKPKISADEVLVQVSHASINPHDYKVILGEFKRTEKLQFPALVGSSFSGTIVAVGKEVYHLTEGDEVFGVAEGAVAEFCKLKHSKLYLKPRNVSFEEISTLPVVGMTTIQAFERLGGINQGDKILIHAGSGGVGTFAIQYAKIKGAKVFTTTGTNNVNWVKKLGADVVIDYKKENYLDICSSMDIVFDTLGGQYTFDAFEIIKSGGKVVSLLPAEINKQVAKELNMPKLIAFVFSLRPSKIKKLVKLKNAQYEFVFMRPTANNLSLIASLIERNKIKPVIEKKFNFRQSVDAFIHLSKGHTKGKITIQISEA